MPSLDPSIPLQVQTPQTGLAALAQPIQTAQGLLALRQNTMQLNANQAISQAYQQSINPDGTVDFNKLQSLAAQNGAGAFLPQFMGQIAQQRDAQQQYDTSKLDMALKQQQSIRGMIGSLALDPEMGKSDMSSKIAGQISDAVNGGLLPLDRAISEIKAIPSDPGAQAQWIQNHLINSLSGEAKIQAMMPQNVPVDTGASTVLLNRNPLTGQSSVGTTVAHGLSPADLAAPKTIINPDGSQSQITTAQWLQMQGGGGAGAGAGYTGRYPGAPGVQTSLSPAQQAALSAQGVSSNTAAQDLHNAAADAPMRVNLLNTARDQLANLDATGPGTDWRNHFASMLQASPVLGNALSAMGVTDPTKIASFDEFKKILTNYASSVSGSLGTGTDARLNAAVTGNANPNISKMANEDILVKTIAAEKMRAAQDYAFQQSGLTTDKFNQWQSQWNKDVNPDAFAFGEMSPTQQQAFLKRQSPQQLTKFKSDLGNLVRSGVIEMPQRAAAPAPAAPAAPAQPPVTAASGVPS